MNNALEKSIYLPLLVTLLFLPSTGLIAQHSRFNAGIIAGLNFSELEGNTLTDYYGVNTGLIGTVQIAKHTQIGVELLFSQNGEYVLPAYYPPIQYGQVWLNHIEIPIHVDWLIEVFKQHGYYDWNVNFGVAYARLVRYRAKDIDNIEVSNQISYRTKETYLLQAGTTYFFTRNIGLNLKASIPARKNGLSWTLAARIVYMIH